jgi:glycosyltransferase involved in cell wall biosynthesis
VKKVVYLTPMYFDDRSYIGGGERWPLNMAIGVAESSGGAYEVEILSYGPEPFRKVLHPGVTLRVMHTDPRPRNPLDGVSWEAVEALGEADIVHVMQAFTRSSEVGYILARLFQKPIVVTDLGGTSSSLGIHLGALELADRVVCYSDFLADMLKTTTPKVTIKGGVDARKFAPPTDRPTRDRVLYVGRLLPHKGIDRLVRACPPDVPLTVCGRPYHPAYFELLRELAVGKQVEFVTEASDEVIRDLYARAWVNVLPSTYKDCYGYVYAAPELMGLTLLEAMACGTPVICARVGAMPEFVRDNETGYVFDTEGQLTDQLRLLAGDPARADRMGRAARHVVETEYDLRVCGERLAEVYDELTGSVQGIRGMAA